MDDNAPMCGNCGRFVRLDRSCETRDGMLLCPTCAEILNFCDSCFTIAYHPEDRRHYSIRCFK